MIRPHTLEYDYICDTLNRFALASHAPVAVPEGLDRKVIESFMRINNCGQLFNYMAESGLEGCGDFSDWASARKTTMLSNLRTLRTSARVFGILEEAGIEAVAMRGLVLAHQLYPDPGLRPMKDVDILVGPDVSDRLRSAMSAHGHEPTRELRSQIVYTIDGIEFEMHLLLLTAKRYRHIFEAAEFLGSRVKLKTREGDIYQLSPEYELIELVAHAFVHHELQGFMRVVDIALAMKDPGLDWEFIARWCDEKRLTRMYLFTLSFINELFRLSLDAKLKVFKKPQPARLRSVFRSYYVQYFGGDGPMHYIRRFMLLMYVAESPEVKFKQFFKIFTKKQRRDFFRLFNKPDLPD